MPERDMTRYSETNHTGFGSISDFMNTGEVPHGIITIEYNGSPLDILNINRHSKTTVIMFHAALSNSVKSLPVFSGMRVLRGLDTNVICLSDPTLLTDESLKLAWFAGNKNQPLQRDLPGVIRKIIDSQNAENIVFFGASGGGFASLYYSTFFPESLAIVLNPQTVIRAYTDSFVLSYAKAAFGAKTLEQARSIVDRKITGDVRHLYRGGFNHTVGYVQNIQDADHVYRHAKSFLDATPTTGRLHMLLGDWGKGHVPPPAEISREILASSVAANGNWSEALSANGFVSAPTPDYLMDTRAAHVAETESTLS